MARAVLGMSSFLYDGRPVVKEVDCGVRGANPLWTASTSKRASCIRTGTSRSALKSVQPTIDNACDVRYLLGCCSGELESSLGPLDVGGAMSPLTAEQQALVSQHIGLVRLQVKRQLRRMTVSHRRRQHEDMVQEGTLGLMQAVCRYDPKRCGPFAPYALTYIHGALCRYLLRQMDGLALPATLALKLVRLRRAAAQANLQRGDTAADSPAAASHSADTPAGPDTVLPRFYDIQSSGSVLAKMALKNARQYAREQEAAESDPDNADGTSEKLRARYEQALQRAVQKVGTTAMAQIDHMALVQAVVRERLTVPDGQFRTSRRAMARRFGCSPTRVWNLETRLERLVRRHLASEPGLSHEAATLICRTIRPAGAPSWPSRGVPVLPGQIQIAGAEHSASGTASSALRQPAGPSCVRRQIPRGKQPGHTGRTEDQRHR